MEEFVVDIDVVPVDSTGKGQGDHLRDVVDLQLASINTYVLLQLR